jgi:hypothetical protein
VRRHLAIPESLEDSARVQPEARVDEHVADHVGVHVPERRQDDLEDVVSDRSELRDSLLLVEEGEQPGVLV